MQTMRSSPTHFAAFFTLTLAVLSVVSPGAQAEEGDEVDPRVGEAMAACLANDLEKGISILAELYAETQDAIWVFNQARCYQQNDRLEDARKRFVEFRRANKRKDLARDGRAQDFIAEIDKELERRAGNEERERTASSKSEPPKPEHVAAPDVVPAYVPTNSPPQQSPLVNAKSVEPKADDAQKPMTHKWWFWTGMAAVVVSSAVLFAVASSGTKTVIDCGAPLCDSAP